MQTSRRLVLQSHLGLATVGCGLKPAASCWVDTELLQLQSDTLAPPVLGGSRSIYAVSVS